MSKDRFQNAGRSVVERVRADITLSTGATVTHSRMPNGAQEAIVKGREGGAMTAAEWDEYCNIISGRPERDANRCWSSNSKLIDPNHPSQRRRD